MDKTDGNIYEIGSRVIILFSVSDWTSFSWTYSATTTPMRMISTASLRQHANEAPL